MKVLSTNRQRLLFVGAVAILSAVLGAVGWVSGPSFLVVLAIVAGIVDLYLLFDFLFGRGPEDRKRIQQGRDTIVSLGYLRRRPPESTDDYKLEKLRKEAESGERQERGQQQ
jgi:hypothetical protein